MTRFFLEIHIDGSGKDASPSWAISVFWQVCNGTWYYGGSKVGAVETNCDHPQYIGAIDVGSNSAELSGMVWAMCFALQFKTVTACKFMYDSMFSACTTSALWKSIDSSGLAQVATGIDHAVHGCMSVEMERE